MKWLVFGIVGLVLVAGISTMNGSMVRSMVFPAPRIAVPANPPAGFLQPQWDLPIHAWLYRPPSEAAQQVLLYFHGNGENLETIRLSGMLEELQQFQIPFLVVDYPGYGQSPGIPSEESLLSTSQAAARWLQQTFPEHVLIVCGWSLGASVAIQTASEAKEVDALVAMSAWTSLRDIAKLHYPQWLTTLVLKDRFDALAAAKKVRVPSLFLHGEEDDLIPATQGKKVVDALPLSARWVLLPGVGHNDLLSQPDVWRELRQFLSAKRKP